MSLTQGFSYCLVAVIACASQVYAQGTGGEVTLFEGARLIAGDGTAPVENSAFLVQGDTITWVGRRGERMPPAGAARVDLTGKTVLISGVGTNCQIAVLIAKSMCAKRRVMTALPPLFLAATIRFNAVRVATP